jgi:hypothetical protein
MPTLSPSSLRFDEEKHQYWLGKKRVPGVSEVLQKVGLTKNWDGVDPFYATRGKAVHLAIQYFLEHRLDESSLDPIIIPFFEGFKKYYSEHPMGITRCEVRGSLRDDFAGTIDCITEHEIIDWKCSKSHDKVAELQGEAYKWIEAQEGRTFLPFKVVQFPGDGSYEIFDYGDKANHWPSVMDLYRWKTGK